MAQCAVEVLDEVVQLFDQALSATDHRAERKLEEKPAERAQASEDRLGLLEEMLAVLTDANIADGTVGSRLRGASASNGSSGPAETDPSASARDHGHLENG